MELTLAIENLHVSAPLPPTLLLVEQQFERPHIAHVAVAVQETLIQNGLLNSVQPGQSVALGVGSRGIANLAEIVAATLRQLQDRGAHPYIVPAMGSHGGATAAGQRHVLAELAITEESMGVPILADMAVAEIGRIPGGPPLYQGHDSLNADHVLLIGRVKPHTSFRSHIESGLAKMAVIGLGKQRGAEMMHALGGEGFVRYLEPAAQIYATQTNLLGGLALIENGYEETAEIVALAAHEFGASREAALLERAKRLMASLPFSEIDVLAVQQMGKNISGTGMDTNIIGRFGIPRQADPGSPDVAVIALLDLTPESGGNANGIGLANITTARAAAKIDWNATYTNAITAGVLAIRKAALPMVLPTDQQALVVALRGCGVAPETARLVFIQDTLTLDHIWVSPTLRSAVEAHPRLRVVAEVPLTFDATGSLTSPWTFTHHE